EFARSVRGPLAACAAAAVVSASVLRFLPSEGSLPALVAAVAGVVVVFIAAWAAFDAEFRSELARALGRGEAA
ncbi:MAG: hypothetical protein KAW67_02230, partial [Candidatus Eisenbacteria sp.]|nr:hypothetical protein [Candidatus Eisenbacteria bacterium]